MKCAIVLALSLVLAVGIVAVSPIGPQHGIEAARQREKELHPEFASAWDKRSDTLSKLVQGHNDAQARLAALEAQPGGPFPFGGSST